MEKLVPQYGVIGDLELAVEGQIEIRESRHGERKEALDGDIHTMLHGHLMESHIRT
jgi:hypothetical protein